MRMRKKKNLQPRMESCRDCWVREPEAMRGRWRELYPQAERLEVELGCGKGRFTAGTAQAQPNTLLIAVEKVPDAMVVAMERVTEQRLSNVFFLTRTRRCCRSSSPRERWTAFTSISVTRGPRATKKSGG